MGSRPLILACLGAGALALSACGQTPASQRTYTGEQAALRAVINGALQSGDPSECDDHMTARYLQQTTGLRGAAALDACRKTAVMRGEADSVEIRALHIRGSHAGGRLAINGGFEDGTTMTVTFVKRREWQFDHVTKLEFDRPRVNRAMVKSVGRLMDELGAAEDLDGVQEQMKGCLLSAYTAMSDARLESSIVDSRPAIAIRPFIECALRAQAERDAGDIPKDVQDCFVQSVMTRLTDARIMKLVTQSQAEADGMWQKLGEQAATDCDDSESGSA